MEYKGDKYVGGGVMETFEVRVAICVEVSKDAIPRWRVNRVKNDNC